MRFSMGLVLSVFCFLSVMAQPGGYAVFVSAVDSKGQPIRDAWVKVIPRRDGIGNIFDQSFLPTEGSHSKFAAAIRDRGKGEYDIEVTASGYDPVRKTILIECCSKTHEVVLERSSEPLPELPKLVTLSGLVTNTFGEGMYGLRIQGPSGYTYSAEVDPSGRYSIKLIPGLHRIEFWPSSCTRYTLEDYLIGTEDKILNLTTECRYRRGASGINQPYSRIVPK